ncbi:MAG: hypothetical protein AAF578_00325 [Pseudomonadota bacterium]
MSKFAPIVTGIINQLQVKDVLDYGCGEEMALLNSIKPQQPVRLQVYDENIPDYSDTPEPSEMVVCLDVKDESTLDVLKLLTEKVLFCTVDSDFGISYWLPLFWERFDIQTYQYMGNGNFYLIVSAIDDHPKLQ